MGAAAGPIGAVSSMASAGFGAMGEYEKGRGDSEAAKFEANRARTAAAFGRVRADQTDAQLREELATTLANIDAVRSAQNVSLDSPTGLAIKDEEVRIGDRERMNRVGSLQLQAKEDDRAALYKDRVAADAMRSGRLRAMGKIASGVGQAASSYR
jgi:hypothetical protein